MAVGAWATEDKGAPSDILPRTVNFLIFVAIIYYFVSEPVKNFFKNRRAAIAAELEKVQVKLKESKTEKEAAEQKLAEARMLCEEIVITAKKESAILAAKIEKQAAQEIENLLRLHNEQIALEQRKMVRDVVKEVLGELLEEKNLPIDEKNLAKIVNKRVA